MAIQVPAPGIQNDRFYIYKVKEIIVLTQGVAIAVERCFKDKISGNENPRVKLSHPNSCELSNNVLSTYANSSLNFLLCRREWIGIPVPLKLSRSGQKQWRRIPKVWLSKRNTSTRTGYLSFVLIKQFATSLNY